MLEEPVNHKNAVLVIVLASGLKSESALGFGRSAMSCWPTLCRRRGASRKSWNPQAEQYSKMVESVDEEWA
jgi:hypothetical protein